MKHPERVEDYLEHIAEAIDRGQATFSLSRTSKPFKQTRRFRMRLFEISRSSAKP